MTRSSRSLKRRSLSQFDSRTLAAVAIGGAVLTLWAFGVAESLWRPALGILGGTVAGVSSAYLVVRATRRRPQLVELYRAILIYLLAPTVAVVIGGLIVALVTHGWRP